VTRTNAPADKGEALYLFGGQAPFSAAGAGILGNKGAGLVRMAQEGLPVPPGFVLPTDWCRQYLRKGGAVLDRMTEPLERGVRHLEGTTGLAFGGRRRPLLISVRSGAPVSMPGMMSTLLNVGLSDLTVRAMIRMTGNPRVAWDSYRRLIQQFAEVVREMPADPFDRALEDQLARQGVPAASELDAEALSALARDFEELYRSGAGEPFPQDPWAQLRSAAEAVFRSWRSSRAAEFRRLERLDEEIGTALTVQAMVFGNMGGLSGSGVGFTRDPANGENALYLDFAWNSQGEDVVSGRVAIQDSGRLMGSVPRLYDEIRQTARRLEEIFRDIQDFEFTVQEGQLYLLQTRSAKRTPWAALRVACDLVREGRISGEEARERLKGIDLDALERRTLVPGAGSSLLAQGIPASPGVATGEASFDSESAVAAAEAGRKAILIRPDISTSDIAGLSASAGIVTARGGRTSHAAVVARQLGKVCVVNCRGLAFSPGTSGAQVGGRNVSKGDVLSIDGSSGQVFRGPVEVLVERPSRDLEAVRSWGAGAESRMPKTKVPG
jgi:pyruvate,orthophosphate dikinase